MPVAILPDIGEQMCIGCALCVEICTSLGPDVLRVNQSKAGNEEKHLSFILKDVSPTVHASEFAQQKQSFG